MSEVQKYAYTVDETETMTMAVLRLVAAIHDEPIMSLPSLYREGVNPEALNSLFAHSREGTLEFDYYDSRIVIHGNGTILVDTERKPD